MAESTVVENSATQLPLGPGARRLGADAAAEQRELLALLLDEGKEYSGFARRGILMRLLDLADLTEELFEGVRDEDPYMTASRLHGTGSACLAAADAIRADRGMVPQ
jgi:hypothetical protein